MFARSSDSGWPVSAYQVRFGDCCVVAPIRVFSFAAGGCRRTLLVESCLQLPESLFIFTIYLFNRFTIYFLNRFFLRRLLKVVLLKLFITFSRSEKTIQALRLEERINVLAFAPCLQN